ncbi:MAG: hypothetical protein GKR96_08490 [Gammaproteobacteria bacterium]|nr:hypothetical protein [Gammaproteobacteria bacterium]
MLIINDPQVTLVIRSTVTLETTVVMKLHLNNPDSNYQITGYRRSDDSVEIKIGDTFYKQSLILTSQHIQMWQVRDVSHLQRSDFESLAEIDTELILLGTGLTFVFPSPALSEPLMQRGIGLEVMDTAAACRTYNILSGDGRNVTAALIV